MQAEEFHDSIRPSLVAMLPRLKRFADLLVGARKEGTALLRRALRSCSPRSTVINAPRRSIVGHSPRSTGFGSASCAIHADPRGDRPNPTMQALRTSSATRTARGSIRLTTSFLRGLPPQQRLTLLLVYAERFDHIDAGRVLDVSAETIGTRLVRISATLPIA